MSCLNSTHIQTLTLTHIARERRRDTKRGRYRETDRIVLWPCAEACATSNAMSVPHSLPLPLPPSIHPSILPLSLGMYLSHAPILTRAHIYQELDTSVRSFLNDASERIEELKHLIKAQAQEQKQPIDQQAHMKVMCVRERIETSNHTGSGAKVALAQFSLSLCVSLSLTHITFICAC